MKTYTESDVVHLIMRVTMDAMGDEWVAQEDEEFKNMLKREDLFETWERIFK